MSDSDYNPSAFCSNDAQRSSSTDAPARPETAEGCASTEAMAEHQNVLARESRRYSVGVHRGKARARLRYIESSNAQKGCRFL